MSDSMIYKYELGSSGGRYYTAIRKGGQILKCAVQDEKIVVWVRIDPAQVEQDVRQFHVFATGQAFDSAGLVFIDTVFIWPFVWHVYEGIS